MAAPIPSISAMHDALASDTPTSATSATLAASATSTAWRHRRHRWHRQNRRHRRHWLHRQHWQPQRHGNISGTATSATLVTSAAWYTLGMVSSVPVVAPRRNAWSLSLAASLAEVVADSLRDESARGLFTLVNLNLFSFEPSGQSHPPKSAAYANAHTDQHTTQHIHHTNHTPTQE